MLPEALGDGGVFFRVDDGGYHGARVASSQASRVSGVSTGGKIDYSERYIWIQMLTLILEEREASLGDSVGWQKRGPLVRGSILFD